MKIGNYYIPDMRLVPNAISDTKKIYDVIKKGQIETKEIGSIFKYKNYNTGIFYRRVNSMAEYGLIEQLGKSSYKVTDLGEELSYPDPSKEEALKTQAVLHVPLWNELFKKYGKNPPTDTFWIQLRNVTDIDPQEAQKIQSKVRKWYMDDISFIKLDPLGHPVIAEAHVEEENPSEKTIRSSSTNTKQLSQQLSPPQFQADSLIHEIIQFGDVSLALPKKDLKKQWTKLQKYMEIYLEDYEEPKEQEPSTDFDASDLDNEDQR